MRFRSPRANRLSQGCVALVTLTLLSVSFWGGCGDDLEVERPQPNAQSGQVDNQDKVPAPVAGTSMIVIEGSAGLNERVFDATIIARANLKSTAAAAESVGVDSNGTAIYRSLLEFRFEALEYIKDTGGSELIVEANDWSDLERKTYSTMELAREAAESWVRDRDTRWDDREALIMLVEKAAAPGASGQSKRYTFGPYGYIRAYAIDSGYQVWLPSASSSVTTGSSSDDLRYLLEVPGGASGASSAQVETISVSEMKALIAKMEKWRKEGEGVTGYLECIRESFRVDIYINGYKERGESLKVSSDYYLDSGLPARTLINKTGGPRPGKTWLGGKDKEFFADENGPLISLRPLRAGTYLVYRNYQWPKLIPCDYFPKEYTDVNAAYVQVTAPSGTLHEAFFDPVNLTSGVGADATNGVLKPTSFTDGNGVAATLQRIAWEAPSAGSGQAGAVKLKLSPHTGLANHVLDFIALDGTVSVSLVADEATVDAANNTLNWSVSSQPWKNGDLLMLRIRAVADQASSPPASPHPTSDSPTRLSTP